MLFSFSAPSSISPSHPQHWSTNQELNDSSSLVSPFLSLLPAGEQLSDFGPAVSQLLVGLVDDPVLFLGPRGLLHLRVEVVVPALAALLADAPLQVLGDDRPALGSVLLHQLDHLG